ncbi:glycine cleavage system aminomethyltransferase GcvT [Fodinibius halophilus]|uniref:Aminomethyltransferase n=1 Tax=Fodinibius halophilus TaxID=1736908 RepID=A0A6M1TF69_9BACT|nr:glycine cleavage system aminomethyltransferase GcvT [Fodinibius halophilus]NGP87260.1 glycine cleavage system aminomethyltransferase GcvT [Fodinibius halophilus]
MLTRTPFYDLHEQAGAKLIDFGGFEMPVQYDSIRKEHNAVREEVGIFDVSHMGEFFVSGEEADKLIQYVTVNDVSKLEPGKAQYTAMCYEDGGIVDDLIVYMLEENSYMLVVNASNIEKDFNWIKEHNTFDAELVNKSDDYCLLAVQGPNSVKTLQKLTDNDLEEIGFYRFEIGNLAGYDDVILSGTGYTGEKGFELYFDKNEVDPAEIWNAILEAGEEFGIEPCGLGARDTLRLEKGYALYGNDITKDTHPLEARMGWLTKLDKGDFIGRDALLEAKENSLERKLVGLTIDDKRSIPRKGYTILDHNDNEIGFVTSGSRSITLGKNIGMGYVTTEHAEEGNTVMVEIRNKKAEATVVKPPFVK